MKTFPKDWKKHLLPLLPYLAFVYLFDKLGQAVRLAPGIGASEKLLHIGQGFTDAFSSPLPGLHPADLCIGIAGAVLIRLIVYVHQVCGNHCSGRFNADRNTVRHKSEHGNETVGA